MTISENLIELGKNSASAIIKFCAGNGSIGYDTTSKQLYLCGTDGAYLARQTDIDNGNDCGIGLVDDNGSPKAIIEAHEYQVAGTSLTRAQMKTAIQPVVHRDSGVITQYGNGVAHYTKIGIWSGTHEASTLRLRIMTGDGFNGYASDNSWIDIFIKKSNTTSGTTGAFGVTYELHNASSAVLTPYVVATAYNSCDIWIKNSWGWGTGWYTAEYNGGVWLGDGSWHQRSVPSGTLQNTTCTGSAVYTGSKVLNTTATSFQFLSSGEYSAITGHNPKGESYDSITVCSGDDSAYRGIMSASIQNDTNVIVTCNPAPGGAIRINYTITTS
jgi:hypothetical protein